ncbi:phosphorothioated DNA-binding restriction endonuclease [Paenibacillus thermotolerans]|uniref:phosphorothioated DNA-binding restriction endonuclease n=1 Tax=Paenibacillus thermotolerans TaxID=3027807 RepID=UPI0023676AB9|nr:MULTISPECIES: HNH endonuclease [unclassified Paenibacillus]
MKPEELKQKFANLTIWKKNGQRAPHKPLLILYALGQYLNGKTNLPYEEARVKLKNLLTEFGPARKSYHPEEPFVRLVGDGIWELDTAVDKRNPNDKKLLENGVAGGFNPDVILLLDNNRTLVMELAMQVLEEHFPDTMHEDILEEVGLHYHLTRKKSRDPYFRERILRAYEHSCAICGFHVRLGNVLVAVEAAHIQWHQAGGPDREENGVALCSLHHKLFDRGVFTISSDKEVLVAEGAYGTQGFEDWLMKYHGKAIRSPIHPDYAPRDHFTGWHFREVFKGPARYRA